MSTEFNNLLLTPNEFNDINSYIPDETNLYPYNNYIINETQSQSMINSPIFPKINNNYNQKSSFDIFDCDISMEDSTGIKSINNKNYNSRSRSPVMRMNNNNPLNVFTKKVYRARSPNVIRKSNFNLDNSIESYELSENNSPMIKSNSITNYEIRSYSPPQKNISNVNNDINFEIPVQQQYNYNNIGKNSYDNIQQQIFASPIKNNNYNYQNILTNSPIISGSPNSSSIYIKKK